MSNKINGKIDVIFLDFRTFNGAPYNCLMKVYLYGITGKTRRWFKCFLGNRSQ